MDRVQSDLEIVYTSHMPKIAIRIAYEGTNFHGWQRQEPPDKPPYRTIQGELDKALADLFQQRVVTSGASRTDSGVHADAQVAAFTIETKIPITRIPAALNTRLPGDMRVLKAWLPIDDFDPVRDAVEKGYRYEVSHGDHLRVRPIFDRRTVYFSPHHMDVEPMKLAAGMFVGEHDFKAFAHSAHGRDCGLQPGSFTHHVLGALGIIPEPGVLHEGVQLVQSSEGAIPVKDASSAVQTTA